MSRSVMRLMAMAATVGACGSGGGNSPGGTTQPATGIFVAGQYNGTRSWVTNDCGPNTALTPLTLTVSHARGAVSATINDGNASFSGTLAADGAYAITPISATLGNGVPFDMTIAGKFTKTGVTLRQTVTERRSTGSCSYSIDWITTKVGTPNDIP